MTKINRNSIEDAAKLTEKFLPNETVRMEVLKFLAEAIDFANQLNPQNWNVNMDKNGKFIRFNVGHEYCIKILKNKLLVICNKQILKKEIQNKIVDIDFLGHIKRDEVISKNIDKVPNCLAKVPDSVGCYISYENVIEYLPFLKEANRVFLEYAILNTKQLPVMKEADSKGFIEYLDNLEVLNDTSSFHLAEELSEEQINTLTEGQKKTIVVNIYERNEKAKKQCLEYWKTNCMVCNFSFEKMYGNVGKDFIHVHHLKPLSQIGKEYQINPIDDLRPVCPNCHAMLHKKNPPYSIEELKQIIQKLE